MNPRAKKNIPNTINLESNPVDFFNKFWDDTLWDLFVVETNRQADHVRAAKPTNNCAKSCLQG